MLRLTQKRVRAPTPPRLRRARLLAYTCATCGLEIDLLDPILYDTPKWKELVAQHKLTKMDSLEEFLFTPGTDDEVSNLWGLLKHTDPIDPHFLHHVVCAVFPCSGAQVQDRFGDEVREVERPHKRPTRRD